MRRVADYLDISELERRFRTCPDPVEARHVQVIWLLAQGHTVGATSEVTAFGTRWIEQLVERYNASGPDALANGVTVSGDTVNPSGGDTRNPSPLRSRDSSNDRYFDEISTRDRRAETADENAGRGGGDSAVA